MTHPDLVSWAIAAATEGNWRQAIKLNLQILKKHPHDTETLNRLGRAYLETGRKTAARQTYAHVLRLDKFNTIAAKNLQLLQASRVSRTTTAPAAKTPPLFLEEPGVTKTVSLTRLGDPKTISRFHPGDQVQLAARPHSVVVVSTSGEYLGRLPDDLASRLRHLIKAGNTYVAWLRSVEAGGLRVFIRETARAAKYADLPSFPLTEKLTYAAFTPPELVHQEKPDVSATEEQEEGPAEETVEEEASA